MKITGVTIAKPGLFDNTRLAPGEGVTVIYGRSGSGKSAIARALIDVLGAGMEADGSPAHSWENLFVEVSLASTHGSFRFVRNGERSFEIASVEGSGEPREIVHDDQIGRNPDAARLRIREALLAHANGHASLALLALGSRAYLTTIAYLAAPVDTLSAPALHGESLRRLLLDDATRFYGLSQALNAAFGPSASAEGIEAELRRDAAELRDMEKRVELIDIQREKFDKLHREMALVEREIDELEGAASRLRDRVAMLGAVRDLLERREVLRARIADIRAQLDEEASNREAAERLAAEIADAYPQFANFDEAKKRNLGEIQERFTDIRDINETIAEYHDALAARTKKLKIVSTALIAASFAALVLAVTRTGIALAPSKIITMGAILGGLSAVSLAALGLLATLGKRTHAITTLLNRKAAAEERLQRILNENNLPIRDLTLASLYEYLLQYFNDFNNFTEKQLELFRIRESMQGPACARVLEHELEGALADERALGAEIDAVTAELGGAADNGSLQDAIDAIVVETASLEESINEKRAVMRQVTDEILGQEDRGAERAALLAEIAARRERHERHAHHVETMHFVRGVLDEAVRRREEKQRYRLINRAAERFHTLTDNQYISAIDREHVRALVAGDALPAGTSQVVEHLMLIAVKLALTEFMIDAGGALPLILDEPFLYMDDRRAARFRELLEATAPMRQVILLTHNNLYKDWGTYIEL